MKKHFFVCLITILGTIIGSLFICSTESNKIIIPSVETVLSNGYPKNRNGQTYGPHIGSEDANDNLALVPDFILVENHDGIIGYIRSEDFNIVPNSIEEALEITRNSSIRAIPMYLQDGITRVGTFYY